jgi:hypothetical protein
MGTIEDVSCVTKDAESTGKYYRCFVGNAETELRPVQADVVVEATEVRQERWKGALVRFDRNLIPAKITVMFSGNG